MNRLEPSFAGMIGNANIDQKSTGKPYKKKLDEKTSKLADEMGAQLSSSKKVGLSMGVLSELLKGIKTFLAKIWNWLISKFSGAPKDTNHSAEKPLNQKDSNTARVGKEPVKPGQPLTEDHKEGSKMDAQGPELGTKVSADVPAHRHTDACATTYINGPLTQQSTQNFRNMPDHDVEKIFDQFLLFMQSASQRPDVKEEIKNINDRELNDELAAKQCIAYLADITLQDISKAKLSIEANLINEILKETGLPPSKSFFVMVKALIQALPQNIATELFDDPDIAAKVSKVMAENKGDVDQFVVWRDFTSQDLIDLIQKDDGETFQKEVIERLNKGTERPNSGGARQNIASDEGDYSRERPRP